MIFLRRIVYDPVSTSIAKVESASSAAAVHGDGSSWAYDSVVAGSSLSAGLAGRASEDAAVAAASWSTLRSDTLLQAGAAARPAARSADRTRGRGRFIPAPTRSP